MKVDLKSFESLEKKIQKTVDLVTKLKDENRSLKAKVEELQESATSTAAKARDFESMRITHEELEKQLKELKDERRTVLERVDGLLEDLDRLQLELD